MKSIRMCVVAGLMASSVLFAGKEFDKAIKESKTERSATYIARLQDLATWMFFEAIHWNAANNSMKDISQKCENYVIEWGYATDALASYISSPAIKEIDAELTTLNSASAKLARLQDYYTQVYKALANKGQKALEGSFKMFTPNLPS
ncbi:MAG: hypothetical protein ACHQVS_00940 [Candidatus Babeliales bacterium]